MLPDGRGLPLPKALATDAFSLQLARDEENGEAEGARGSDTSEGRLDAGETARALKVKKAGEPLIARLWRWTLEELVPFSLDGRRARDPVGARLQPRLSLIRRVLGIELLQEGSFRRPLLCRP